MKKSRSSGLWWWNAADDIVTPYLRKQSRYYVLTNCLRLHGSALRKPIPNLVRPSDERAFSPSFGLEPVVCF